MDLRIGPETKVFGKADLREPAGPCLLFVTDGFGLCVGNEGRTQ